MRHQGSRRILVRCADRHFQRAVVERAEAPLVEPKNAVRTALTNSTIGIAAISSRIVALSSSVGADLKDFEVRVEFMVNLWGVEIRGVTPWCGAALV
jgi:hypothetical protein